jgi:hypothetical protein
MSAHSVCLPAEGTTGADRTEVRRKGVMDLYEPLGVAGAT